MPGRRFRALRAVQSAEFRGQSLAAPRILSLRSLGGLGGRGYAAN